MTWSPFLRLVTPGPTSTTMPAPSWPRIAGKSPSGSAPESVNSSVWQIPVALISTMTSPAFGPSSCTVAISSGLPAAVATAARTSMGFSCSARRRIGAILVASRDYGLRQSTATVLVMTVRTTTMGREMSCDANFFTASPAQLCVIARRAKHAEAISTARRTDLFRGDSGGLLKARELEALEHRLIRQREQAPRRPDRPCLAVQRDRAALERGQESEITEPDFREGHEVGGNDDVDLA